MKKVTTQIVYKPRTVTPQSPTFKAVIIDAEHFVLDEYKAYTYASADFTSDDDTVLLHDNISADLASISVLEAAGKVKSGDTAVDLLTNGEITNIGIVDNEGALKTYEWGMGLPVLAGPITVDVEGIVSVPGSSLDKSYYMVAKIGDSWVVSPLTAVESTTTAEGTTTEPASRDWTVDLGLIADDTYADGDCMIYEDLYGVSGTDPSPASVYLSIDEESTATDYRCQLIEITNASQLADMYGEAAMATPGNIAYSAYQFLLYSGGAKSFYIAPITSADDISDLIEELKTHDDTYYLIYNYGSYSTDKAACDALYAHVKVMSSPLYKRERRLYVRMDMAGTDAATVQEEKEAAINAALGLDNERVSVVLNYGTTDSFIRYCARRYAVSRDYCLTYERIAFGSIWDQVSHLSDADKEELKDNGVVAFDQETPTSAPIVMFQTTTYIEQDILAKKEENIQIAIDELCWSVRQVLLPRIAKGMDNKVTADPTSATSLAYISNLNADISAVRRAYANTFASISIMGVELDELDPRHVRMHIAVVPYYNVNRIDVYIYVV